MASPRYPWNGKVISAAIYSGPILAPNLIERVKGFSYEARRTRYEDKSDWSWYPTVFSQDFDGYSVSFSTRDIDAARYWYRLSYLDEVIMESYDAEGGADKVVITLQGLALDNYSMTEAWGSLVEVSLSGFCSSIKENGERVEGDLPIMEGVRRNNFDTSKDTVNQWNLTGVLK